QLNDATGGTRTGTQMWADPTGLSYQSTTRWGVAQLVSELTDPTDPGEPGDPGAPGEPGEPGEDGPALVFESSTVRAGESVEGA
ncbi:sugar-binding protein, partial [Cellulomonas bogoriensis]|uniref:sugar-binding protein n=1 Tax=Cellulomonas bogoriensis TaxID=301388 RepID=UPI00054F99EF